MKILYHGRVWLERITVEEGLSVVKYVPNHVPGSLKGTRLVLCAWKYGGLLFARSSVFEA